MQLCLCKNESLEMKIMQQHVFHYFTNVIFRYWYNLIFILSDRETFNSLSILIAHSSHVFKIRWIFTIILNAFIFLHIHTFSSYTIVKWKYLWKLFTITKPKRVICIFSYSQIHSKQMFNKFLIATSNILLKLRRQNFHYNDGCLFILKEFKCSVTTFLYYLYMTQNDVLG